MSETTEYAERAALRIAARWGLGEASPHVVIDIQQAIDEAVKESVQPIAAVIKEFCDYRPSDEIPRGFTNFLALAKERGWIEEGKA